MYNLPELYIGFKAMFAWHGLGPLFPQLKNEFPGMNSEISWNLSQFPEIKEGHSVRVHVHKISQFAQHTRPVVHS